MHPDSWIMLDASYKAYDKTSGLDPASAIPFAGVALANQWQAGAVYDSGSVSTLDNQPLQSALTNHQTQLVEWLNAQSANSLVSEIDAKGHVTYHTYDQQGNELSRTDPLKRTTTFTYDSHGNILTKTDPEGYITKSAYDDQYGCYSTSRPYRFS